MEEKILKIKDICIVEKIYPRKSLNEGLVKFYSKNIKKGDKFPNVFVAYFEKKHILVDGRHRLEAYKSNGEDYIKADIKNNFPSMNDIYVASIRANLKHGLRFSIQDRIKIAYTMADMKFHTADIFKISGISENKIQFKKSQKFKHILIKDRVDTGKFPKKITEKVPEQKLTPIIDEKEHQIYELNNIIDFFREGDFDLSDSKVSKLIRRIKKSLRKRFPKL